MTDPQQSTLEIAWAPYTPDKKTPWDLRRVVHLHRRAGFAATVEWRQLLASLRDLMALCPVMPELNIQAFRA